MGVDQSFQERIGSFRKAFKALKISPFYGLGIASSHYIDNQYTRTLHEIGIIGLFLWFWIFLRLYKMARWLYGYLDEGILRGLSLGYAAGIIGILIHAFGSVTFYVVRIMEPFWFVSGLVVALYLIKVNQLNTTKA